MADEYGVVVEYWDFQPPLEAVYWAYPGLPPVIGLARSLFENRAHFRCVMAEELGHHFTSVGKAIYGTFFHYRDRLEVSRIEHRAMRWAALHLMPSGKLFKAIRTGINERWELAEHFEVTEDMVDFRMSLPDVREKLKNK